jgi:hypothetical protein
MMKLSAFLFSIVLTNTALAENLPMAPAIFGLAMVKGAADACHLPDQGAWEGALRYVKNHPEQKEELGNALAKGYGFGAGAERDRNFPASCAETKKMISKAGELLDVLK